METPNLSNRLVKLTWISVISYLSFILSINSYTAIVMSQHGILSEVWSPTILFYLLIILPLFGVVLIGVWKQQPWMVTIGTLLGLVIIVFDIMWNYNFLGSIPDAMVFFPFATILEIIWIILIMFALVSWIFVIIVSLINKLKHKNSSLAAASAQSSNEKKKMGKLEILSVIICFIILGTSFSIVTLYTKEGTITRTIEIDDTNTNANFIIWDFPDIDIQIPGTNEIDLGALTENETRMLTAFSKMNTTFYTSFGYQDEWAINQTTARLKMIGAFNLTAVQTIWYSAPYNQEYNFPTADHADNWIGNARQFLEVAIQYNFSNVQGICADSEGEAEVSAAEYLEQIAQFESFIAEMKTNNSLGHPDPKQGTFKSVLCFDPRAIYDNIDGDADIMMSRFNLGLPPYNWDEYHFMLYRSSPKSPPVYSASFFPLLLEVFGPEQGVPITGCTGTYDFNSSYYESESYFTNSEAMGFASISGWEAMKREIFYAKALGFHSISTFHLNGYTNGGPLEKFAFMNTYGLEGLEELADEWNAPKTVVMPISQIPIEFGQRDFYNPITELKYDFLNSIGIQLIEVFCILITVGMVLKKPKTPENTDQLEDRN